MGSKHRLILNGFHNSSIENIPLWLSNHRDVEVSFTIEKGNTKTNGKNAVNIIDATYGQYPIEYHKLTPVDATLLENLAECELMVLKMMDRLEQHIGAVDYHTRKAIFLKHVQFWNHVIKSEHITHFVSANIPHENYDYVIYCLCKYYGIKTIFFHQTIPNFVMALNTINPFLPSLEKEFEQICSQFENASIDEIPLSDRAESVFQSQVNKTKNPTPVYMKKPSLASQVIKEANRWGHILKKPFSSKFYKNALNFDNFPIFIFQTFLKPFDRMKSRYYSFYYEKKCKTPDLSKKFIYLPLHMQPELSTVPLAGEYSNQMLMAQVISANLPDNVFLYIKENPKQTHWCRSLEYYKQLSGLRNTVLVSKKYDTFKLINSCKAMATATGTAGWESLFRETPVLMFGSFFYQYAKGVFRIKSEADLQTAMDRIFNQNFKPDLKNTRLYLKAFDNITLPGYYNPVYKVDTLDSETNERNLFNRIIQEL